MSLWGVSSSALGPTGHILLIQDQERQGKGCSVLLDSCGLAARATALLYGKEAFIYYFVFIHGVCVHKQVPISPTTSQAHIRGCPLSSPALSHPDLT